MLTQLTKLTQEIDGRYANDQELQFLEDYLQVAQQRISTYEKIRDAEDKMIKQVEVRVKSKTPNLFDKNRQDVSSVCERDRRHTLRCLTAAILMDDLQPLKNSLMWQKTIMCAFKDQNPSKMTYQVMSEIMAEELTDEEISFLSPGLNLIQSFLG